MGALVIAIFLIVGGAHTQLFCEPGYHTCENSPYLSQTKSRQAGGQ